MGSSKVLLSARALVSVVLLPGIAAGYVPLRLVREEERVVAASATTFAAILLICAGASLLGWCVWDFFAAGHGTLAPIDPPRRLVVRGLYRVTRNPMYNAVILILLGESLLFQSFRILAYAAVMMFFFHLFIVLYEEPALTRRFPDEYRIYRREVPRWGIGRRRFREHPRE